MNLCAIAAFVTSALLCNAVLTEGSQCNATELDKCLANISDIAHEVLHFNVTCEKLDLACSMFFETAHCVENKAKCAKNDTAAVPRWTPWAMSLGYICTTGKEDYIQSQMCLNSKMTDFKGIYWRNCPETYRNPIENNLSADESCRQFTEMVTCVKASANIACGLYTAKIVGKIRYAYLHPPVAAKSPSCKMLNMTDSPDMWKSDCDMAKFNSCLSNFEKYSTGFALGTVVQSNISDACEAWKTTRRCVLDAKCYDIEPEVMSRWLGKKTTIGYICSPRGMPEYLGNIRCMADPNFLQATGQCGIAEHADPSKNALELCQNLSEKLNCIKEGTRRTCDEPSTEFMNKISPWLLGPDVKTYSPWCTGHCNETVFNHCLEKYEDWSKFFDDSPITEHNIDKACWAFYKTQDCVKHKAWCMSDDMIGYTRWSGQEKAASMICGEHKETYLKNRKCLQSKYYTDNLMQCFKEPYTDDMAHEAACGLFEDKVKCAVNTTKRLCGGDAANLMMPIIYNKQRTQLDMMFDDCPQTLRNGMLSEASQCNPAELDKCLANITHIANKVLHFDATYNELDMACYMFFETAHCVENKAKCAKTDFVAMSMWTPLAMSLGYICTSGKENYIQSQMCLNSTMTDFKGIYMRNCPETYRDPIENNLSADEACHQFTEKLTCAKAAANIACGLYTAKLVGHIKYAYLHPAVAAVSPTCKTLNMTASPDMMQSDCNMAKFNSCLSNFKEYSTGFALGTVVQHNISDACQAWNMTRRCILDAKCYDIEPEVMSRWLGKKTTIGYTCHQQGMSEYLGNIKCMADPNFLQATGQCGIAEHADPSKNALELCQNLSEKLNCIKEGTRRTCDEPSTEFMNKISPWLLGPDVKTYSPWCTGHCNETIFNHCIEKYGNWSKFFDDSPITKHNIDTACWAFHKTQHCVKHKAWCMSDDMIGYTRWSGQERAASMICGEHKETYLKHRKCLQAKNYTDTLMQCFKDSYTADMDHEAACNLFDSKVKCAVDATKRFCGNEAGTFVLPIMYNKLRPDLDTMFDNCPKSLAGMAMYVMTQGSLTSG